MVWYGMVWYGMYVCMYVCNCIWMFMGEILPELYCLYHHTFRTKGHLLGWLAGLFQKLCGKNLWKRGRGKIPQVFRFFSQRKPPMDADPFWRFWCLPLLWSNALSILWSFGLTVLPSGKQRCHMSHMWIEHLTFADHVSKAKIFRSQSWLIWLEYPISHQPYHEYPISCEWMLIFHEWFVNPIHISSNIPWVWCFHIAAWTDMDARKRSEALSKMMVRTQPPQKDKANPTYMIYIYIYMYIYMIYIWSHIYLYSWMPQISISSNLKSFHATNHFQFPTSSLRQHPNRRASNFEPQMTCLEEVAELPVLFHLFHLFHLFTAPLVWQKNMLLGFCKSHDQHGSLVMSPCFTSPNHDRYMVY